MTIRKIPIATLNNSSELYKALSFTSTEIIDIKLFPGEIHIYFNDGNDLTAANNKIDSLITQFKSIDQTNIIEYRTINKKILNYTYLNEMTASSLISDFKNGLIGLNREAIKLFNYFNKIFYLIALDIGAVEKQYPVLLPIEVFKKTGYIRNSPQYGIYCSTTSEDIDNLKMMYQYAENRTVQKGIIEPEYALSPSACFHSYMEYENTILSNPLILTFTQRVFRNEGRFNWNDFGRLRDYTVREIVFIGNEEFVMKMRKQVIDKTICFIESIGLSARLCAACDPFVIPAMQKFKKIQLTEKIKYELQADYEKDKYLAIASFNLHGAVFCDSFKINFDEKETSVSGCVGFGLERWVLSFLAQYTTNINQWPALVRSALD